MNETIAALVQNFDALQTVQLVMIFLFAAIVKGFLGIGLPATCLLYTSPSPRDGLLSRMPSSA